MGVVAVLFGTGELLLALAMHGEVQIAMFIMVGLSYFITAGCWRAHYVEQNNYIATQEKYK